MADPELETIDADVAVIGSGGAGLMCVLHAATADPGLDIAVISKGAVGRSGCTRMVQGGYNAVLDPSDTVELHSPTPSRAAGTSTTRSSPGRSSATRRRSSTSSRPASAASSTAHADGRIHQKAFAGQRSTAPSTAATSPGSRSWGACATRCSGSASASSRTCARSTSSSTPTGEPAGVTVLDVMSGALAVVRARVIVVATGGAATMFRIAAPSLEKTGDGVAMCWRAGRRCATWRCTVPPDRAAGGRRRG